MKVFSIVNAKRLGPADLNAVALSWKQRDFNLPIMFAEGQPLRRVSVRMGRPNWLQKYKKEGHQIEWRPGLP
jgi:hypothetical protein